MVTRGRENAEVVQKIVFCENILKFEVLTESGGNKILHLKLMKPSLRPTLVTIFPSSQVCAKPSTSYK